MRSEARRYLGLELAGAKNQKTSLAALEFYPTARKIFLLDIFDRIVNEPTGDEALLEVIDELRPGITRLAVNVPLVLPPCIPCTRRTCPLPAKCTVPAVKWVRGFQKRKGVQEDYEVTPYTQRPVEIWIRHEILPQLPEGSRFEIDEALGGNRAPLTARMHFLKRHLKDIPLVEAWPKLSVALLAAELGLGKRVIAGYRHLEQGAHFREEILETLSRAHGIFIYERDLRKLAQNLNAFDAFICAYTALLSDNQRCAKPPSGFPIASGWVQYPKEP